MSKQTGEAPMVHSLPSGSEDWVPFDAGVVKWLRQDDDVMAGIWRCTPEEQPGVFEIEFPENETVHVLKGRVSVEVVGGPTVELGAGDSASFVKGTVGRWKVLEAVEEFFVLA